MTPLATDEYNNGSVSIARSHYVLKYNSITCSKILRTLSVTKFSIIYLFFFNHCYFYSVKNLIKNTFLYFIILSLDNYAFLTFVKKIFQRSNTKLMNSYSLSLYYFYTLQKLLQFVYTVSFLK